MIMRILCVIDSLGSGGAQRQLVVLAIGFKEAGHDVSFLVYHNQDFYKLFLEEANIPVKAVIEANYFKRLLKMRKFIRHGSFDSVLSFLEAPNFICEVSSFPYRKWKLVIGERSANPAIMKSPKLILLRWFHFFTDYVVANSNANIEIVLSVNPLLSKSRCKVILNAVDFSLSQSFDGKIPRKDGRLKLIVIASHRFLKNLNGLVDALSLLPESELSKLSIDWYGDSLVEPYLDNSFPEAKQKIARFKLDEIITFYPATKEITQKIHEADAIGLFSFYEGLPNTICEGMACGKPVICTEVSDLQALLAHDSNLLCNSSDPHSIMRALRYLIGLQNYQRSLIGLRNLKIAREKFEKKLIISEYLALLK